MVNQDQNDFDAQQDFDEFDNLVDDNADILDMEYMDEVHSDSRKKRQTIFYLVLVLMIAIGGGAAWFLFFRPADTVTPLPMPGGLPPAAESVTSPPSVEGLPPGISTPEETARADMRETSAQEEALPTDNAMPFDQNEDGMPPALEPAPVAENQPPVDGTLAEALPPPQDQAVAPVATDAMPAAIEPAPDFDVNAMPPVQEQAPVAEMAPIEAPQDLNTATPAIPAPTGNEAALNVPATTPVAAPVSDDTTRQLQQRLAEMEAQVQTLSQELQQVRSAPVSTSTDTTSGISAGELQGLNEKLDRLTQQVDALDQRTTTFATELQKRADAPQERVAEIAKPAKPKPAPRKAAPKKPAPRATSAGGWELRSAQPGVAWLGRLGASEMGRYAVGQNVPGLGTVQAVTQENGRWIVKTTGGTLRQ